MPPRRQCTSAFTAQAVLARLAQGSAACSGEPRMPASMRIAGKTSARASVRPGVERPAPRTSQASARLKGASAAGQARACGGEGAARA